MEGKAKISFENGKMIMQNASTDSEENSNFVLWCDKDFPSDILIEWKFRPIREPGLCILFFAATGKNGESIFDKGLAERSGDYPQYHHGDINAFHVSYFRRKQPKVKSFPYRQSKKKLSSFEPRSLRAETPFPMQPRQRICTPAR